MSAPAPDKLIAHARGVRPTGAAPVDIISVQSQMVYGCAGNNAAVPPLLALGLRVAAVPTTLLSNAPVYPTTRGQVLSGEWLADLLRGVEERDIPARAGSLLSGYLASVANGRVLADWIEHVLPACPRLKYCLDAVLGDAHIGMYVEPGLEVIARERLLPRAWLVLCNVFELEQLSGRGVTDVASCIAAARGLLRHGPQWVVVHGIADEAQSLTSVAVSAQACWRVSSPHLAIDVTGTGDVFAAVLVGLLERGAAMPQALAQATAGVHAALEATLAAQVEELDLRAVVPAALADGRARFAVLPG